MLDWSRLKTYQNSKYKSFEELCYQLAKRLHGSRGRFTSSSTTRLPMETSADGKPNSTGPILGLTRAESAASSIP